MRKVSSKTLKKKPFLSHIVRLINRCHHSYVMIYNYGNIVLGYSHYSYFASPPFLSNFLDVWNFCCKRFSKPICVVILGGTFYKVDNPAIMHITTEWLFLDKKLTETYILQKNK